MEVQELDLDKYYERLLEIRDKLNSYDVVKNYLTSQLERIALILYGFQHRRIMNNRKDKSDIEIKWEIYFKECEHRLNSELGNLEYMDNRYNIDKNIKRLSELCGDGKVRFQVNYFFPNKSEQELIKVTRDLNFNNNLQSFKGNSFLNAKSEKAIIEDALREISYIYEQFYESGEPVQMVIYGNPPRDTVAFNISIDLGEYDFVKYLKNELIKLNQPIPLNQGLSVLERPENTPKNNKDTLTFDKLFNPEPIKQDLEKPDRPNSAPNKVENSPKKLNTVIQYREYARYFINGLVQKGNTIKAKKDTMKYFGISSKTLDRALSNSADLMDRYKDKYSS